MAETRVVKRYANRKLYDTQRSRYVTLDQIAEMIRSGEDVKIVDNNTKEDLTAITLAQIIFEEEKKASFMPLSALRNIIQTGGQSIQQFATQTGERMRSVFTRDKKDGEPDAPAPMPTDESSPNVIKDFLERSQQTFDEWQKKVDERIHRAVELINPMAALEKEVKALSARLEQLEKRLENE